MRTLIIHCEQGMAGSTPNILKASRIMRKLEMKGSIARFAVACADAPAMGEKCEEEVFVICDDFKGSDYDVNAIQREFNCNVWVDVFNHSLYFRDGKWHDSGFFWTTDPTNKQVLGWYKPINGVQKYLVDTPF